MTWRTDIENIPRSTVEVQKVLNPDGSQKFSDPKKGNPKPLERRVICKARVWVDFGDGSPAGQSHWLPDDNRWCGAVSGQEPIAFIELPDRYIPQDENSKVEGVAV